MFLHNQCTVSCLIREIIVYHNEAEGGFVLSSDRDPQSHRQSGTGRPEDAAAETQGNFSQVWTRKHLKLTDESKEPTGLRTSMFSMFSMSSYSFVPVSV